jgi:hypothetical protein
MKQAHPEVRATCSDDRWDMCGSSGLRCVDLFARKTVRHECTLPNDDAIRVDWKKDKGQPIAQYGASCGPRGRSLKQDADSRPRAMDGRIKADSLGA